MCRLAAAGTDAHAIYVGAKEAFVEVGTLMVMGSPVEMADSVLIRGHGE